MKIAVIGAGWAGLAVAVTATAQGHQATVFEASQTLGGRARALDATLPDGTPVRLDNGQHILIGAYTETLRLMRQVGVPPPEVLLNRPLALQFPDGLGLRLPDWPAPLDALAGIAMARGWSPADKATLLRSALRWRLQGFQCDSAQSVSSLCRSLSPRVMAELIEPLCVSALNTPADQASASVFLRVLRDALFGVPGGSHLLLPRTDLCALFPDAASRWLRQRGGELRLGERVPGIAPGGTGWRVQDDVFDAVILAGSATHMAQLLTRSAPDMDAALAAKIWHWTGVANALRFEAITTVYAWAPHATLSRPMLALRSTALAPAQFAFDRGQLGGPSGLLAFVVSASQGDRVELQAQVLTQAQAQLGLGLQAVQTVVEKRATFACTPGLQRPAQHIAPGLLVAGDYVAGPYPATLEGAVRSGVAAAAKAP